MTTDQELAKQIIQTINIIFEAYWPIIVCGIGFFFVKEFIKNFTLWCLMRVSKSSPANPGAVIEYHGKRYRIEKITFSYVYLIRRNKDENGKINEARPHTKVQIPIKVYWGTPIKYFE